MANLTPQQALDLALDHHRSGRHAMAEDLYRQLLRLQPENADLVHLLGILAFNTNRQDEGRALIERSVAMNPGMARYHSNLGSLLVDLR